MLVLAVIFVVVVTSDCASRNFPNMPIVARIRRIIKPCFALAGVRNVNVFVIFFPATYDTFVDLTPRVVPICVCTLACLSFVSPSTIVS